MTKPAFLITIDTEGDNLWGRPHTITTENARHLPRFQSLCEHHGLRPTWLTNHEMALCPHYQAFAQDFLRRGTGEVGMHLHAWNSPPLTHALTEDDMRLHPYLIEYPTRVMAEKIHHITDLLETTFGQKMRSHRAGRWAFNETYARILIQHGYQVDCSVTPHVSWKKALGNPQGAGGTDYRHFPEHAYTMDPSSLHQPGHSPLLQVPVSIRKTKFFALRQTLRRLENRLPTKASLLFRLTNRLFPELTWLRPTGRNLGAMLALVQDIHKAGEPYAEFMLHSSELMPGGSPFFRSERDISRLYEDLEALFAFVSPLFSGCTLAEFYQRHPSTHPAQPRPHPTPQTSHMTSHHGRP